MAMVYGRRSNGAVEALVIGATLVVVGVFLYRRSGRDWESDMKAAQDWLEDRTGDAQKVLDRTERASKDLLSSAQDRSRQAIGAAKGAYEGVRDQIG